MWVNHAYEATRIHSLREHSVTSGYDLTSDPLDGLADNLGGSPRLPPPS
jgi:hypothetical protein